MSQPGPPDLDVRTGRDARAGRDPFTAPDPLAAFDAFGVDATLLRGAFDAALSRGADWAELFFEHRVAHHVGLEDGQVNRASVVVDLGVGVRVVWGDQTGYAYTEEITPERVRDAAAAAALLARGPARERPEAFRVEPSPRRTYGAVIPWRQVDISRKVPVLERLHAEATRRDPRIRRVRIALDDSETCVMVIDSSGRVRLDRQPMVRLAVGCTGEHRGRKESAGHNLAGRSGFELLEPERLDRLAREAADRTTFLFEAEPAPAGELPVVLAAGSAGILLHEAIGHGMEADFNRKGISVYSDRLNRRVAPPEVTIVDDATQPGARGSLHVDDEGVDGQRTVLVEGGTLRSYLHDRISAAHYGVSSTGNGRRQSFRHAPIPRMRTTYMLPGPHSRDEIVRSVKRGIYAETFTNGQVMIGVGDFTFYIKSGYLIEDGRLTRPIKDTNIIGNGPDCLEQTCMVGDDLRMDDGGWVCGKAGQSVPVSLGMPTVKIARLTVGGVNRS